MPCLKHVSYMGRNSLPNKLFHASLALKWLTRFGARRGPPTRSRLVDHVVLAITTVHKSHAILRNVSSERGQPRT